MMITLSAAILFPILIMSHTIPSDLQSLYYALASRAENKEEWLVNSHRIFHSSTPSSSSEPLSDSVPSSEPPPDSGPPSSPLAVPISTV
jgi:hypothetical protein